MNAKQAEDFVSGYKSFRWAITMALLILTASGYAVAMAGDAPQEVLVGTDVRNLGQFKIQGQVTTGKYHAESGGAVQVLTITTESGYFKFVRIYHEPGMPEERKIYRLKVSSSSVINSSAISVAVVEGGLLFLERKPGSLSIPSDLWIFYSK